ncbi:MAG TPA: hypothetical protein VFI61_02560 [Patescibacteria group bacterium]|nr:hypothetical protein [Patescibacteria group bacterium]
MSKEFSQDELLVINKFENLNQKLKNLKIATDIDGVEINSAESALDLLNQDHGKSYKINDLIEYMSTIDFIKRDLKHIEDPVAYAMELWNSDRNLSASHPVSGSLILSSYLHSNGIDRIHRITSRPSFTKNATFDWYKNKMPWVDPGLIHIQEGGMEINHNFKVDQINKLEINLFFEDSWEHAEAISKKTKATVILVPQPWNYNYLPKIGSRIIKIPRHRYQALPKMIQVYSCLSDIIV